eukprot:g5722.t1
MATPFELLGRKLSAAVKDPLLPAETSLRRRLPLVGDYRRPEWKAMMFFVFVLVIFSWNLRALWSTSRGTTKRIFTYNAVRQKMKDYVLSSLKDSNATDCAVLAAKYPEPWTPPTKKMKIDLRGTMHAYYRWDGEITQKQLNFQRNLTENRKMPDNTRILFKVKDSRLYVDQTDVGFKKVFPQGPQVEVPSVLKDRFDRTVELILLALELYSIPDVDFALELQDHTYGGPVWDPVFTYSHWAGDKNNGFTFPSFELYERSLGEHQTYLKHECLNYRYPYDSRIRKVAWRGASTGHPIQSIRDIKLNQRVALSFLGKKLPDIFDVGLVEYVQADLSVEKLKEDLEYLAPLKEDLSLEEYNKYAAVIDLDGNAWSDLIALFLSANTPIFKQEYSHWSDFFGHLLTDNKNVVFFKDDLTDLVSKVDEFLRLFDVSRVVLEQQIESALEFAIENVSQNGVIRAAAYALTAYASLEDWVIEQHEDFKLIPASRCCKFNTQLPKELVKTMSSSSETKSDAKQ